MRIGGLGELAVDLFEERALARGCPPTVARGPTAETLCARLGGLPLAIELAAARTGALTPAEILEHLDDPGLLADDEIDLPERHRSVAAVFEWSYALLEPGERVVLDHLGLFPGGASLHVLDAVCGVVDGGVAAATAGLVDASMVSRSQDDDGSSRYRVQEALRLTAAAWLGRPDDDKEAAERRVVGWMASWCEEAGAGFRGADERRWRARIDAERANIGAAVSLAIRLGEPDAAARMCSALTSYVQYGLDLGVTSWLEATAAACADSSTPALAEVLATLAMLRWLAGDAAGAAAMAADAETVPGAPVEARAHAIHVLGLATDDVALLEASVELADSTTWTTAAVAFRTALVFGLVGTDPAQARRRAEEGWERASRIGNPTAVASAHLAAGGSLLADDPAAARRHFEMCAAIAAEVGNRMLAAMADVMGSMTATERRADGVAAAVEAAAALRERGARVQAGMALLRAADLLADLGDTETARALVRAAPDEPASRPAIGDVGRACSASSISRPKPTRRSRTCRSTSAMRSTSPESPFTVSLTERRLQSHVTALRSAPARSSLHTRRPRHDSAARAS